MKQEFAKQVRRSQRSSRQRELHPQRLRGVRDQELSERAWNPWGWEGAREGAEAAVLATWTALSAGLNSMSLIILVVSFLDRVWLLLRLPDTGYAGADWPPSLVQPVFSLRPLHPPACLWGRTACEWGCPCAEGLMTRSSARK